MSDEELKLRRELSAAWRVAEDIERRLFSPSFGWSTKPPPSTGIIETNGFISNIKTEFGWHKTTFGPGAIDASVYEIPTGTLWRHRV